MARQFFIPIRLAILLLSIPHHIVSVAPAQAESALDIALRLQDAGRYDQVFPFLQKAVIADPNNPEVHFRLMECHSRANWEWRANQEAQIYRTLAPNGPHMKEVQRQLDSWQVRSKLPSSNLDQWSTDYYASHEYNSGDDDPFPEWIKKRDEQNVEQKEFGVSLHIIQSKLYQRPVAPTTNHDGEFLTQFSRDIEHMAQETGTSGDAVLYLNIMSNGILDPVFITCTDNGAFKAMLKKIIGWQTGSRMLITPGAEGAALKVQLSCGMRPKNIGGWRAITKDTDATTPYAIPQQPSTDSHGKPTPLPDTFDRMAAAEMLMKSDRYNQAVDTLWPLGEADYEPACTMLAKLFSDNRVKHFGPTMAFVWWKKAGPVDHLVLRILFENVVHFFGHNRIARFVVEMAALLVHAHNRLQRLLAQLPPSARAKMPARTEGTENMLLIHD